MKLSSEISTYPGPTHLLINALAITGITYIVSFRLLNVRTPSPMILSPYVHLSPLAHLIPLEIFSTQVARAAKEFDRRVPVLRTSAPEKDEPTITPRKILPMLMVVLVIAGLIVAAAFTIKKRSSQLFLSIIMKAIVGFCGFSGFAVVCPHVLSCLPFWGSTPSHSISFSL